MREIIHSTMKQQNKRHWPKIILGILAILIIVFLLGPRPPKMDFTNLQVKNFSTDLQALEDSINRAEASLPMKPDNQARIVWVDTPYQKTPYSIVYINGNAASQEEGDPIHEGLAHRYGCNLYLSRLEGHGLKVEEPMLNIDPVAWMQSALDAISVGKSLGEKVILVTCSTGSMLGLYLESKYPGLVAAHIMMSPNIDLANWKSFMLTLPWGLQMARMTLGGKYYGWDAPNVAGRYWYTKYRIEGIVTLKALINKTMNKETFGSIKDPVFMAYYFLDEDHQDKIVSVKRMLEMYDQLGTPAEMKRKVAVGNAGTHIIGSDIFNDNLNSVWEPMTAFCEEVLKLPANDSVDYITYLDLRLN